VEEVPRPEQPLLAVDEQPALAGQDEERLLLRLGVVEAVRLARLQHAQVDAELLELGARVLEPDTRAERLGRPPLGVPHVDDEPAVIRGHETRAAVREARLRRH
jgi:hypothetical protein